MTILNNIQLPEIVTDDRDTLYSHESFETPVFTTCHHSGTYLTRAETNPKRIRRFQAQHDFPGLPKLDKAFSKAAHADRYQHIGWNDALLIVFSLGVLGFLFIVLGFLSRHYALVRNNPVSSSFLFAACTNRSSLFANRSDPL